jgi:hypothetical protein
MKVHTKRDIAGLLLTTFPELYAEALPPEKPWAKEDHGMTIFDAVSLAVADRQGPPDRASQEMENDDSGIVPSRRSLGDV